MGSESEDGQNNMEEAGGRECEKSRVKKQGSCRSNEMNGRCESDCKGYEVYPATFGNKEKTGLKLDRRSACLAAVYVGVDKYHSASILHKSSCSAVFHVFLISHQLTSNFIS